MTPPDVEKASNAAEGVPWVAIAIVLVSLLSLPAVARIVRAMAPAPDSARVGWGVVQVMAVAGIMIATLFVTSSIPGIDRHGSNLLVLSSIALLVPALAVVVVARRRDPRGIGALGLQTGDMIRAPLAGLIAYVLLVPGLFALALVWVFALGFFGVADVEQSVIVMLRSIEGHERWLVVLLGVAVQPFFEELLFRGFLQPVLVQRGGAAAGIVITSITFALLHGMAAFLPIFALSCLLGYVMLHTRRLHAAWAVHMLHNGLQFLFLYVLPEPFQHAAPSGGLIGMFTR